MVKAARDILTGPGNLALAVLLILATPPALSQTTDTADPTASLQQVRASLQQLDTLASACLTEPGDQDSCETFRQAVDGELLRTYLENCAAAKRWRDDFIASEIETPRRNDGDSGGASEVLLGYLIDIEYLCGENALARATDSVLAAYGHIRLTEPSVSAQTQWNNWQQQQLRDSESRRQSERLASQRRQLQQQTSRQFDQLELELLRQQSLPPRPR
ncbi:MAG: hypothetical protein R3F50_11540 [Gammaproteobacteria bacterium]|jgi:hypothetical protein